MAKFQFKGADFSYIDQGKGQAVVLLHGFLENKKMWNELVDFLPKKFRTIQIDLPGHGSSDCLAYVHSMEEMSKMVLELLKHLKIKKAHFIGHSMGGYVALAAAEVVPDSFRSLILMNSTAKADSPEKQKDRNRAIALVKRSASTFVSAGITNLFRAKNRKIYREKLQEVKKEALKTPTQGIIAALEGMKNRMDREVILHFAPFPILMIAAKNDPILAFSSLKEQLEATAVQALILNDGHMSHIEEQDVCFAEIRNFLNKAS